MPRHKNILKPDTYYDRNTKGQRVCNNGSCNGKILLNNRKRHLRLMHPDIYAEFMEQILEQNMEVTKAELNKLRTRTTTRTKAATAAKKMVNEHHQDEQKQKELPKQANSGLLDLFDTGNSRKVLCNNGQCKEKQLYRHAHNLKRHLKRFHFEIYTDYMENRVTSKPPPITNRLATKDVINYNSRSIATAIVELFTTNGLSLQLAEDRAFQILVQPAFDKLSMKVSEASVMECICAEAKKIKKEILKEKKGKMLSLKIDVAAREEVCLLAINIQYVQNSAIHLKTLAINRIQLSQTTEYMSSLIVDVLSDYDILLQHILSVTIGGSGVSLGVPKVEDINSVTIGDSLQYVCNQLFSANVTTVRCSADMLQHCLQNVKIQNVEMEENMLKWRTVARKLRSRTYLTFWANHSHKKPIDFDSDTGSWATTFENLENLYEAREIIDGLSSDDEDLQLSTENWDFVNEFLTAFRSLYNALMKLQMEQLCYSELYVIIMDVIIQTKNIENSEISRSLVVALNELISELFENQLFAAAVFLDPRLKICLNLEQTTRAESYITSLYQQITSLKSNSDSCSETETNPLSLFVQPKIEIKEEPSTSKMSTPRSFFEFLQNLDDGKTEQASSSSLTQLDGDILIYKRSPRSPIDIDVLDFWQSQNNSLTVVAESVLAAPCTQISEKRLLSSLNYVYTEWRDNLLFSNLDTILFVKANAEWKYR